MKLNGHSGCDLKLLNNGHKIYVEKKSSTIVYNERLKSQCEKQKSYDYGKFKEVKVIDYGYQNDLFYFDMEYVSGITLAEYMRNISIVDIDTLSDILFSCALDSMEYDRQAKNIFSKKLNELEKKLNLTDGCIKKSVEILEKYEWKYVIRSKCHGDFTLENIIVFQNNMYLIDFLDSFYESWQIDYAKLLQDVELFWHYRNENKLDENLLLRLLILKEDLQCKVLKLKDGNKLLETIYHILLLNVLRIFPYTNDEETYKFLIDKLYYIIEKINH
jgi:serine/threonine protein kinase